MKWYILENAIIYIQYWVSAGEVYIHVVGGFVLHQFIEVVILYTLVCCVDIIVLSLSGSVTLCVASGPPGTKVTYTGHFASFLSTTCYLWRSVHNNNCYFNCNSAQLLTQILF